MKRAWPAALALALAACGAPPSELLTIHVGPETVGVRVLRRAEDRRRGMQGVTSLGQNEGMLFLYRRAGTRTIWMGGCELDLDVAFIDDDGRVLQIDTLKAPMADEEPQRTQSRQPASMVLEMQAGWFERHGLGIGTRVVLPSSIDRLPADP